MFNQLVALCVNNTALHSSSIDMLADDDIDLRAAGLCKHSSISFGMAVGGLWVG
jgi:hypothetical protein